MTCEHLCTSRWPQNLHGRDDKFHPTFKSGMDGKASIFHPTIDDLMSSRIRTSLYFQKYPRGDTHRLP